MIVSKLDQIGVIWTLIIRLCMSYLLLYNKLLQKIMMVNNTLKLPHTVLMSEEFEAV